MGMAASQARFLGLTARQNNVEFEGQQINQQRTMLSNQSANYYNDLLGMKVPTPPSVDSYTKTMYTFNDGALVNTITAMIAQSNGTYVVSYLSKWQDDYTPVAAATSVVTRDGSTYSIGATKLRDLGVLNIQENVGNVFEGKEVKGPDADGNYYTESVGKALDMVLCTQEDEKNFEYYLFDETNSSAEQIYKDETTGTFYSLDENNERIDRPEISEDNLTISIYNANETNPDYAVNLVEKRDDGYYREKVTETTSKRVLTQEEIESITTYTTADPMLKELSSDELRGMLKEEQAWAKLLEQKYGSSDWLIRYVTDTTTGVLKPYFYEKNSVENAQYDSKTGNSQSAISCYTIGSEQKVEEFKGITGCKVEKDSSGRLINLNIPRVLEDGSVSYTQYALTTETATDQDAYNDAMNEYEYEKFLYDQAVENINSKIEIIQAEDKNLELRLKQLDTEQKAINTEKEAVSKIIEKNTSDTFKTFSA